MPSGVLTLVDNGDNDAGVLASALVHAVSSNPPATERVVVGVGSSLLVP